MTFSTGKNPSRRRLVALATLVAAGFCAVAARASETYPGVLKSELGLDAEPPCTVCHQSDKGGKDNSTRPFSLALKGLGLVSQSPKGLRSILQRAEGLDSDEDGVSDLDELREGRDPNVWTPNAEGDGGEQPRPPATSVPPVLRTGCSLGRHPAGGDGPKALGASFVLALSLELRRMKRRRRRTRSSF